MTMRKEHPEQGPSGLSCHQRDRGGNSSHAPVPKITEPVEFYREAEAAWLRPRAGLGAFSNGLVRFLQSVLIFIL